MTLPRIRVAVLAAATTAMLWLSPQAWRAAQAEEAAPLRPGASRPVRPEANSTAYPRRKVGLWEIRSNASDQHGLPPAHFCVGENTDNPGIQLDRAAGTKGSCTIGAFRRVGTNWTAETVCKDSRQTVISQSVASGDFLTEYRIDTLVFYSPPLPSGKREDREAVTGRYLGACKASQRAGDLELPGMGTLNMNDGTLKP